VDEGYVDKNRKRETETFNHLKQGKKKRLIISWVSKAKPRFKLSKPPIARHRNEIAQLPSLSYPESRFSPCVALLASLCSGEVDVLSSLVFALKTDRLCKELVKSTTGP
jgi:hypothetical protein